MGVDSVEIMDGGAIARPLDTTAAIQDPPLIQQILKHAARSTGCNAAVVCRLHDGELAIVAGTGAAALLENAPIVVDGDRIELARTLMVHFSSGAPTPPVGFRADENRAVRFATGERIAAYDDVFLIVLHDRERRALSLAQTYVLRAHAAHLATMFELETLRDRVESIDFVADRARIERLRLLESVAVNARDSILITEAEPIDLPGPRVLYCNAAFTRATGYSAAEIIGKTPRILQGPKSDPQACARIRQALATWQPIEIELINYRKDGTEFWVELSIVPVADERGWFTHWVSVQRDITERREAEQLATRIQLAEVENQALATEIHERKRVEAELLYTAFHDSLTRLRNRSFFMERLAASLQRASGEAQRTCSVLFLDLDQFKIVNDSLGHVEGDALLKEVAQRLKSCVRPHDTLARMGGDEFAILIEDATDLSSAICIAERIIEALRAPVQLGRQSVFPSCSIGIAQSSNSLALPEQLLRNADIAMYAAKRAGYGDYAIFDASMQNDAVERLTLQTDLRRAVDGDEFYLVYQPIVEPASGRVLSFEGLLRWEHPSLGLIEPSDFIHVAEAIGLIRQIDRWVMRQSLAQLAVWQRRCSNPGLRLSVNTSAAEFVDPDFMVELTSALAEFELDPNCLELEITESIFLLPSPAVEATIAAIRALGVRIALDDFGTGYSSLSYITRYPIDTIKIDKSFIDTICTDDRTFAIVDLIIGLGATLGLNVIAEGVESQDQADALTRAGCTAIQGYHFARPLSPCQATDLLDRSVS